MESNVTVSHEDDDVIMAESGLNLAELDMQDDRELIHMVLEDANFEAELEGDPTSTSASTAASASNAPTAGASNTGNIELLFIHLISWSCLVTIEN